MTFREGNQHELTTEVKTHPIRVNLGHNGKNQQDSPPTMTNSLDDTTLCQLIKDALRDPKKAEALAHAIDHIPEIKAYLGWYQQFYDQALPYTMRDITQNIHKFPLLYKKLNLENRNCQDPDDVKLVKKYFINWVVMILKRDCKDVYKKKNNKKAKPPEFISTSQPIGDNFTIEDVLASTETNEVDDTREKMQEMLSILNQHPKKCPECTCQEIAKRKYLNDPPQTWEQMAQELNCSYSTIYSHWRRTCLPKLKAIAQELGLE